MAFPDDFWWGTGASSTQCEGAAPASDWYREEQRGTYPRSGDGNGFGTRYAEDFALLRRTRAHPPPALDRVGPHRARGGPARRRPRSSTTAPCSPRRATPASSPWVCLHHFTLPGWFTEIGDGAFCDDRARSYHWARHVAFCAETFGDLVFGWKPINEPFGYVALSYQLGVLPPRQRNFDRMLDAYRGILLAQRDAWRELRGGGTPVATIHNLSPLFPVDDSVPAEHNTRDIDALMWGVWMRADRDGVLALPGPRRRGGRRPPRVLRPGRLLVLLRRTRSAATGASRRTRAARASDRSGTRRGARASASCCGACTTSCPGRPLLVCEHGVGTDDDAWRCDVLRESLAVTEEAIDDGVDVRGFFHWTGVDNYEWTFGYDVPFGLFDRDRQARPSAELAASYATA